MWSAEEVLRAKPGTPDLDASAIDDNADAGQTEGDVSSAHPIERLTSADLRIFLRALAGVALTVARFQSGKQDTDLLPQWVLVALHG